MKKLFYHMALLLCSTGLFGQANITLNTPRATGGTVTACRSITLKPGFKFAATSSAGLSLRIDPSTCDPFAGQESSLSADRNYIRTKTYTTGDGSRYVESIQYFDGLGRPIQTVQRGITPGTADLVTLQEYDALGRKSNTWLPGVAVGNNGAFIEDPRAQIKSTYDNDANPYVRTDYEASPLNRPDKQFGPGESWHNNGKAVKTAYKANVQTAASGTEDAKLVCGKYWATTDMLFKEGNYPPGELYVTQTQDEDGNTGYEFKDKLGQVLLTRQVNGSDLYDTYYIYDDLGNLQLVMPPMLSQLYNASSLLQTSSEYNPNFKDYAYRYRYDYRNRCIWKKLPGADPVYYVYDKADRLILSQDGEQRKENKWAFNIYDVFGRLVMSGLHTAGSGENLTYFTDNINAMVVKESPVAQGGSFYGYTTNTLHTLFLQKTDYSRLGSEVMLINYYDNYDVITGSMKVYFAGGEGNTNEAQPAGFLCKKHSSPKGMMTGQLDFFKDGQAYVPTVWFYDNRGRVIQQRNRPPLGLTVEFTDYDFVGHPTKRKTVHAKNGTTYEELYTYDYDHAGRLIRTTHALNNQAPVILAENTYDELGRLEESKSANTDKLKTNYKYNIRSWTKSITGPEFSQTLYYQDGSDPLYNGNISKNEWTSEGHQRSYAYTYDNLSRLKSAVFRNNTDKFSDTSAYYDYDRQGNMTSLERFPMIFGDRKMDVLSITYSGNRLKTVTETGDVLEGFKSYFSLSPTEQHYLYDANAAMKHDKHKGFVYSYKLYNGMPKSISVNNFITKGLSLYEYTATGVKLTKSQYHDPNNVLQPLSAGIFTEADFKDKGYPLKETRYENNLEFENWALKRILIENGYIENNKYYFYIKDYLGNNRVVADQSGVVVQRMSYYPFGMSGGSSYGQPYKFGGKELDAMLGLNLYDFHARQQMPDLGIFTRQDPLAEKYYSWSPYAYCMNNPILFVDPDGMSTHTDSLGHVVAVYNNDDMGVYKHNISTSSYDGSQLSADGGTRMGETEYWDEFSPIYSDDGKGFNIQFGKSFDPIIADMHEKAQGINLIQIAEASRGGGLFDIKKDYKNVGGLLNGKYATSRSAGNFLAGYNAESGTYLGVGVTYLTFQQLAGALHIEESHGKALRKMSKISIVISGDYASSDHKSFVSPMWGEIPYQYRMSKMGWDYGKKK